ncbi:FecR domain-containing protein [Paraburkholderia acidisoli]|uniref:FecR domain-containing protein n=1 Tax=Paraburkholderia acidisoli TaxID=2571748 RepID=UPI001E60EA3A|nr:FecR domain-containing protein [Paraburkholderia acidisoli]
MLAQAASWLVRMQEAALSPHEHAEFERWRAQSEAHRDAWSRAERVRATFASVPPGIAADAVGQLRDRQRRSALRGLGALLIGAPVAWFASRALPWRDWTADYRTATGEQKRIELADGTRVLLDTATAIDVSFDGDTRRLRLVSGRVRVTTGHDPGAARYRPFVVETAQGTAQALGTRFTVRTGEPAPDATTVSVAEGVVVLKPAGGSALQMLRAGQQAGMLATGTTAVEPAAAGASSWEQGMLMAQNQRLADVLAELARYRHGVLHCDPAVAALRVSGAFPLDDIDASLSLLARTLPVQLTTFTPLWIGVGPRRS